MKRLIFLSVVMLLLMVTGCKKQVESVSVTPTTLSLKVGQTCQLQAVVKPDKAPQEVTWISNDMTVAETDAMGNVKALAEGECEIYACADVFKAVCKVKVTAADPGDEPGDEPGDDSTEVNVDSIVVSPGSLKLKKCEMAQLTATVYPVLAEQAVTWVSSNVGVATVTSAGTVYAVGAGECSITASAGNRQAVCTVSVVNETDSVLAYAVGGVVIKMLRIEGGTFSMGTTLANDSDAYSDEGPIHSVTLSDYYMAETEVTQALWKAVMGENPSYITGNNRPVESVSWDDCQAFITKLNQMLAYQLLGKTFRLPTEAEWEYAARGGNRSRGYKYAGSNTPGSVSWYKANSGAVTHDVGTKAPNELGLYDMSGNVYEWCSDWLGDYSATAQTNPTGATTGNLRVVRGGSWKNDETYNRITARYGYSVNAGYDCNGLRLVLEP